METENNKSGALVVFGSIIASICIVLYLAALVQGSIRIYLSIEDRKEIAEAEFNKIASTAQSKEFGFLDDLYIQAINDAFNNSPTIEALIITGASSWHIEEKRKGHAIDVVENLPRFKNKFSFSNQRHEKTLAIEGVRNTNIYAVATAFDYNKFSEILKQTLLIILIGFALSSFTMLLNLLMGISRSAKQSSNDDTFQTAHEYSENKISEKQIKKSAGEPRPSVSAKYDTGSGPKGLYSPRSNIGWEEYTNDRLDSELHRCSSAERDLVLILMEFTGVSNDDIFCQLAEEAVKFFTSRDLIFEYGKMGISIILPSCSSLDIGIARAEKFHQHITEKYINNGSVSSLNIGLSSRSGRLLNADRIFMETKEALKKAKSDSNTSIIGFRSDPEKYRAYIRTQI